MPPTWCKRQPTSPSLAWAAAETFFPPFFGARRINGIEINPAIFEILTDKFADFSGHLDRQPGVSLVNAEARSYINHSSGRYDLIQISLIDTWAATAAGGLTLTENRLYTVEAWNDFYRALKPGGLLSVSRWYDPIDHRSEFYRLVAIAASALQRTKVCPQLKLTRPRNRAERRNIVTVITRPDAFTDAQWQAARTRLLAQGFKILLGPDVAFDSVTSTLLSGNADAAYFASLPENIAPSTDDNPFFFYTDALRAILPAVIAVPRTNKAAFNITVAADHDVACCVRVLHRHALRPSGADGCRCDADATRNLFLRDRYGLHADRDIADAAADGLPWASRLWAGCGALHDSSVRRVRQHHCRCAYPPAERSHRAGSSHCWPRSRRQGC